MSGWVSGALVLVLARRRFGGFTGDVLGAAGAVCETAGLVVACSEMTQLGAAGASRRRHDLCGTSVLSDPRGVAVRRGTQACGL